jgi:hypothetical protein
MVRQAGGQLESVMDAFITGGPTKGAVRWQMDVKPEDLNRGNNLVSEQLGAHPIALDKRFSCSVVGELIRTVTGLVAWS